ncbi:hypothetical protein DPEC_G00370790 [Dallia pectoralis]|nr:hypothetical protein DPEC_G00370790 [Dallia pectoralis]
MTTPPLMAFAGQQPGSGPGGVNTAAALSDIGQETVQDIALRTMEIFQLLRNMQLPNGVTYHPNTHQDRLGKLQEHLRMLVPLFPNCVWFPDKCKTALVWNLYPQRIREFLVRLNSPAKK